MPRHHHLREKPQQLTEPPAAPRRLLAGRRRRARKVKSLGISPPRTPRPLSSSSGTWGRPELPLELPRSLLRAGLTVITRTSGRVCGREAPPGEGGAGPAGAPGSRRPPGPRASAEPAPATLPGRWTPPSHLPLELLSLPACCHPFAALPYIIAGAQTGGRIG